jgi:allantoinase
VTQFDLVVRAARAITPAGERARSIGVQGGRITAVEPMQARLDADLIVETGPDEVLLPGLVDTHVHVNEPGRTQWEGFETATLAAAAGGITTILDMPLNSIPATVDVCALQVKKDAAAGKCHVDVGFWGGAVPGNEDQLRDLHDAGVFGFKCFLLPSGVEEFPHLSASELEHHLQVLREFDALMIVHAEDGATIEHAPSPSGGAYEAFLRSRPRAAENVAIAQLIEAARSFRARVHLVHLSSSDAVAMLRSARSEGVRITVETCPHYLSFAAETILDGATEFKCCPPIREADNREALWSALSSGVIDCVVSDHSPCVAELKRLDVGDFGLAWGGIASVQIALPAIWTQARARGHSLVDVAAWMAQGPARIAGLRRKGTVEVGYDADFCVLAPEETFTVDAVKLQHRNPITPYAGQRLHGVVRSTWLRGRRIQAGEPCGQFLTRGES